MMKQVYTISLLALLAACLGCTNLTKFDSALANKQYPAQTPVNLSRKKVVVAPVVTANTKFGFKLFAEVLKADRSRNVFISPTSVAQALAMTYNGASGETQQAMAQALDLQGLSLQEVNSANASLLALLANPEPQVQLAIANSLWANKDYRFEPSFRASIQEFYHAQLTSLDFGDRRSQDTINNWVKQSTHGKIDKIVDGLRADDVLFLINAIYFKGSWTEKFDKQQTTQLPFHLASGQQKPLMMMSQTGKYQYYENQDFQAVKLPYGNGRISLEIFLPKQINGLSRFEQNLNPQDWEKWQSQFNLKQGYIRLPRFRMDYEIELKKTLTALGMGQAFSRQANFERMGKNIAISEVLHKTFVDVNEEGTEAAAVTSTRMVTLSAPMPNREAPFRLIVDRPFFCAIRDQQTGSVLFMGSIVEPQ